MKFASDVAAAIAAGAQRHGLETALVAAIVRQESGGNPDAARHEPGYRYVVDVETGRPFRTLTEAEVVMDRAPMGFHGIGLCSASTEWVFQRTSWGLCQVMGANAREHGCKTPFLTALLDPSEGVEYGCRYLADLRRRYDLTAAISAYNAGKPLDVNYQTYVVPVLRAYDEFKRGGF